MTKPRPRVGLCLSCMVGRHEECNDAVTSLGCACVCVLGTEEALESLI